MLTNAQRIPWGKPWDRQRISGKPRRKFMSVPGLRFLYLDYPIRRYVLQLLHLARRPTDFDQIDGRLRAQSEVHRTGTGGRVTTRRSDVVELCPVSRDDLDSGANRVAIALGPL